MCFISVLKFTIYNSLACVLGSDSSSSSSSDSDSDIEKDGTLASAIFMQVRVYFNEFLEKLFPGP